MKWGISKLNLTGKLCDLNDRSKFDTKYLNKIREIREMLCYFGLKKDYDR